MARAAKSTIDHDTIRNWVESKGGHPAAVKGTGKRGDPGIIRIDFPGFTGERSLGPISWDQFFKAFEASELALLYRDEDRFNKLVGRDTLQAKARGERRGGRRAAERELPPEERAQRSRARVTEKGRRLQTETTRSARPTQEPVKSRRSGMARTTKSVGRARGAAAATSARPTKRTTARTRKAGQTAAPRLKTSSKRASNSGHARGRAARNRASS